MVFWEWPWATGADWKRHGLVDRVNPCLLGIGRCRYGFHQGSLVQRAIYNMGSQPCSRRCGSRESGVRPPRGRIAAAPRFTKRQHVRKSVPASPRCVERDFSERNAMNDIDRFLELPIAAQAAAICSGSRANTAHSVASCSVCIVSQVPWDRTGRPGLF